MAERTAMTLQQGIWIDQQRLAEAGLQDRFEITVQLGEIRIRAGEPNLGLQRDASGEVGQPAGTDAAWDVFRCLGADAQPGRLANPSTEHDRYLYGAAQ